MVILYNAFHSLFQLFVLDQIFVLTYLYFIINNLPDKFKFNLGATLLFFCRLEKIIINNGYIKFRDPCHLKYINHCLTLNATMNKLFYLFLFLMNCSNREFYLTDSSSNMLIENYIQRN